MTQIKNSTSRHYQQLQSTERGAIETLNRQGKSIRFIATELRRSASTISRELRRGTTTQIDSQRHCTFQAYFAETGEAVKQQNRRNSQYKGIFDDCQAFLSELVKALKMDFRVYSVDTFVHCFKVDHPNLKCPSTPTVYRYIDDCRLPLRNQDLPMKLRRREKRHQPRHSRMNKHILGQSIEKRPAVVETRAELGHWEGDLVKGKRINSEPALMTLTERVSRLEIIVKIPDYHASTCRNALQDILDDYGPEYFKTVTFDNGSEFSQLNNVIGTEVYFAHPYSPWERGTNENANGMLREFVPKGQSISSLSIVDIQKIQDTLNSRPRRSLNYLRPLDFIPSDY